MMRSCPMLWSPELLLLTAMILTTLISSIYGDPANNVQNGDFERQNFVFKFYPQMDAAHDGMMGLVPFWQTVYGGVQVLDGTQYLPDPAYGGSFIMHLNYAYGPGVFTSSPLITPRKGATYNLSFDIADNPDGGPIYKALGVKILVNNQEADPVIDPYNVSAPASERSTISWVRVGTTFVGTGEMTQIQFESLTPGSFGALIDNVNVTLLSLVDNGSFEETDSLMVYTTDSWYNVITGPSDIISSWTVLNGALKRVGGAIWELASDSSVYCLDMNAEELPGTILSDPFSTIVGMNYVVLFDAAASPEDVTPLDGVIFGCVKSSADGAVLAYTSVEVNANGFSRDNIGWQTYTMNFVASNASAVVEFVSRVQGSNGPILDNVLSYQVVPTGKYKSVPLTYSIAATPPRPRAMRITVLAGLTSLCTWKSILCNLDYLFLQRAIQSGFSRRRGGARN